MRFGAAHKIVDAWLEGLPVLVRQVSVKSLFIWLGLAYNRVNASSRLRWDIFLKSGRVAVSGGLRVIGDRSKKGVRVEWGQVKIRECRLFPDSGQSV
jgi:hypothetical protein